MYDTVSSIASVTTESEKGKEKGQKTSDNNLTKEQSIEIEAVIEDPLLAAVQGSCESGASMPILRLKKSNKDSSSDQFSTITDATARYISMGSKITIFGRPRMRRGVIYVLADRVSVLSGWDELLLCWLQTCRLHEGPTFVVS